MTFNSAILATLAYHDIFDYPLSPQETYSYLITKSTYANFETRLQSQVNQKEILKKNGLLFLKGRGQLIKLRQARSRQSRKMLKKAQFYGKILRFIPTVKLVAISGALSMENSDPNDDIDLVIVTSAHSLWTTRLLANLLLQPHRRKVGELNTKEKACLNLFLDESHLKISTQNLYTAHELAQLKPIWQRGNTYQNLIKANIWLKNYLPNWQPYPINSYLTYQRHYALITKHLALLESFAKLFQLRYMKSRITSEKIGDSQLFFHPGNTEQWVLATYSQKLKKMKISRALSASQK